MQFDKTEMGDPSVIIASQLFQFYKLGFNASSFGAVISPFAYKILPSWLRHFGPWVSGSFIFLKFPPFSKKGGAKKAKSHKKDAFSLNFIIQYEI